jgi:hypothetical protein
MRPDRRLVDIDTPARAVGEQEFAVFYDGSVNEKLIRQATLSTSISMTRKSAPRRKNAR